MTLSKWTVLGLSLLWALSLVDARVAFYLPGVRPKAFEHGASVAIWANKLDSIETQLPYGFYQLPFCPVDDAEDPPEKNLGEILSGEVVEKSAYNISMGETEFCKLACTRTYSKTQLDAFRIRIREKYSVHMILDNLPVALKLYVSASDPSDDVEPDMPGFVAKYERGFPLGGTLGDTAAGELYLNNHWRFKVLIHADPHQTGAHRIVGFEVEPMSVRHDSLALGSNCKVTREMPPQGLVPESGDHLKVSWTYDVLFELSPTTWQQRWDHYLIIPGSDSQIHWFAILNSIMIVLFLSAMVAMIMTRTLRRDFVRYDRDIEDEDAAQEETGWKLVHGDVFRPPAFPGLFVALTGAGFQVILMTLLTLMFALLGFLSPVHRGYLLQALLLLFVFMGSWAGYASSRLYRTFGRADWKRAALLTALLYPGINFAVFFVLNLFVWGEHSSLAVDFGAMFVLLLLWFGVSVPLVFFGAHRGFQKDPIELPCKVRNIASHIPEQAWYLQPQFAIMAGGVLPFGAVFIELFYIMSSVWLHQFYYVFGFLYMVFVILCITCAEITIVFSYFHLCAEDYNWWWRSFLTSGSSAVYMLLYSVLYFFTQLHIVKFTSSVLFFGYMFLAALAFFVLTGAVGFAATFTFIKVIYSSIKIE